MIPKKALMRRLETKVPLRAERWLGYNRYDGKGTRRKIGKLVAIGEISKEDGSKEIKRRGKMSSG